MNFVNLLETKNLDLENPTWEDVENELKKLKDTDGDSVFLQGGSDAIIIFTNSQGNGFYITAREENEHSESVVFNPDIEEEMIEVLIEGNNSRKPKSVFVSEKDALNVAKTFFDSGKKSMEFNWIDPYEIEEI